MRPEEAICVLAPVLIGLHIPVRIVRYPVETVTSIRKHGQQTCNRVCRQAGRQKSHTVSQSVLIGPRESLSFKADCNPGSTDITIAPDENQEWYTATSRNKPNSASRDLMESAARTSSVTVSVEYLKCRPVYLVHGQMRSMNGSLVLLPSKKYRNWREYCKGQVARDS